eukprot:13995846-Heterocapsa_arctica.AAC.1
MNCDCCFGEKRRRVGASSAEEEGDVTPVDAPDDLPVIMSSGATSDSDLEAVCGLLLNGGSRIYHELIDVDDGEEILLHPITIGARTVRAACNRNITSARHFEPRAFKGWMATYSRLSRAC